MPLYDRYRDIEDQEARRAVRSAILKIQDYCEDIPKRLRTDFTITVEGKSILFFDIRHSNPHYYIEILRESGIVNVRGYGLPTIKIIGG